MSGWFLGVMSTYVKIAVASTLFREIDCGVSSQTWPREVDFRGALFWAAKHWEMSMVVDAKASGCFAIAVLIVPVSHHVCGFGFRAAALQA